MESHPIACSRPNLRRARAGQTVVLLFNEGDMSGSATLKLNQTTSAVALLLFAGIFGGGYAMGRHAIQKACQAKIDAAQHQVLRLNKNFMELSNEYMRRLHSPPAEASSGPSPPAAGRAPAEAPRQNRDAAEVW